MRHIAVSLLLLSFLYTNAQSNWHTGIGITTATLNFQQNGSGGLAFPVRYDLLKSYNSTLSLGTNIKIGTEDQYGLGFPLILGLLLLSYSSGQAPDLSNINTSDTSKKGTSVCFFTELPLLLHYNWGLGSNNDSYEPFGFYLGGGMSYTITGYTNSAGNEHSTSFYGMVANAGIRFARNKDLGFSATFPFTHPIGPINNPVFYQLTFSIMSNHR